ncbi:DUF2971 domain-containing protein [Pedobacter puniceum]|uniref:DUF2971 domain-containing protein n=1 Tax=Pedobacter puniceum TaxID=2666136 RepID=A0A7K0FPF8_9SPHI|nr:DUF2971 domain-containing protein [Pedobacter puniceum]MRX46937.1 DUF2971 domain-containing protein [Pedobacter puniceum]
MLYHYTSINTLALILKNKKIRFNRLDLVDDVSELDGIPSYFSSCVFVSCWTGNIEESIPLWRMYTPNMKGVRISLKKDMFQKKEVKKFIGESFGWEHHYGPLSAEEAYTNGKYMVANIFENPKSFFKKVIYEDEFAKFNHACFSEEPKGIEISLVDLGMYKHSRWSFQEESRFILYTNPLLPLSHPLVMGSKSKQLELAYYCLHNNIPNTSTFIDVDLEDTVLQNISVTLGPLCDESDEILVNCLLAKYAKNGIVNRSELTGAIRLKQ